MYKFVFSELKIWLQHYIFTGTYVEILIGIILKLITFNWIDASTRTVVNFHLLRPKTFKKIIRNNVINGMVNLFNDVCHVAAIIVFATTSTGIKSMTHFGLQTTDLNVPLPHSMKRPVIPA